MYEDDRREGKKCRDRPRDEVANFEMRKFVLMRPSKLIKLPKTRERKKTLTLRIHDLFELGCTFSEILR